MIDPGRLKRILDILKYEASRKGGSGATPEQRRAYYDDLLSVGESSESKAKRSPWKSRAPQHGFRGPNDKDREGPPVDPQDKKTLAIAALSAVPGIPRSGGARPITETIPELGRGAADFGTQALKGLGTTGARIPEGYARMLGEEDAAKYWEDTRNKVEEFYGPAKTGYGTAGGFAGMLAPMAAGLALGGSSVPGILAAGAAVDAPLEASSRDFSALGMASDFLNSRGASPLQYEANKLAESPRGRGAVGAALGGGLSLAAELMPSAKAARQASREAKETAKKVALERSTPPLPPIMKDADQAAIDKALRAPKRNQAWGPDRRATPRPESQVPALTSNAERGSVDPAILKGVVRTGVGAAGGGAAASGEGGLTPTEGALIGAGVANIPALMRARRGAKAVAVVPDVVKGEKVAQHPTLISDLKPKVKDDYDVTISALADSPEGVPEVVARAERLKPDLPPKYTRGKAEREALAEQVPLEEVLAKPDNAPFNDVDNEVLRLNYNKNRAELTDLYEKSATTIDAVESAEIGKRIDELEGVQDRIVIKRVPTASEQGRALASLRGDFAAGSPLAWIQKSQKLIGRTLTTAEKEEINVLVKAGKQREASEYVKDLLKPLTMGDVGFWTLFRKGGSLLASPISIARPLLGNPTNLGFNAASRPATILLDVFASLLRSGSLTGARTTSMRGTGRQVFEGLKGAASGIPEGGRIMLSGLDDAAARKLEIRKSSRLKSPFGFDVPESVRKRLPKGLQPKRIDAADMWTQFWLRAQGAADRPFRTATISASYAEQAELAARQEARMAAKKGKPLSPKTVDARIKHLRENPTPEMAIVANLRADHVTFQSESFLTDVGAAIKTAASGSEKIGTRSVQRDPMLLGAVEMPLPFTRTPGSIVQQNIEATPFGALGVFTDAKRLARAVSAKDEVLANEIQRRMASRGGRAITGSVIGIWLGGKWYSEGKMLATPPESGSERTQFFDEGKSPFSLLLKNRWVSMAQLGPVGAAVAFGAMLAKLAEQEGKTVGQLATDPIEKVQAGDYAGAAKDVARGVGTLGAGAAQTTAQLALETPFLTGTREVLDVLQDPSGSFGEKAINTATSFIPNVVGRRARSQDPVVRSPEGLVENVKTKIPGQSQDVKPSLMAASGVPKLRETDDTRQSFLQSVMGSSPDRTKIEPILAEMESVGAAVGKINQREGETDEAYFKRQQFTGDMVQLAVAAMASPSENAGVLRDMGLDKTVTVQGREFTLSGLYKDAKARPNDPDMKLILQAIGEAPGFPADMENAGDILEYAISRARTYATKELRARGIR